MDLVLAAKRGSREEIQPVGPESGAGSVPHAHQTSGRT